MDHIWWFGEMDMISVVCNGRDPAVEPENLVNKIITTMKHGVAHGNHTWITVVGTTMPPHRDILYIVQNMCRQV